MASTDDKNEIVHGPGSSDHSPRDSVILERPTNSTNGLVLHGEVPKSNALHQPLVLLESRLQGNLESWSDGPLSQNIDELLDYVAAHRLKHMPHKGSKWDSILQQSVAFTSQVHHFETAVADTLLESKHAASIIYSCIHVLLEVRPFQHLISQVLC